MTCFLRPPAEYTGSDAGSDRFRRGAMACIMFLAWICCNLCDGILTGSDGIRIWDVRGVVLLACVLCSSRAGSDRIHGDAMSQVMLLAWVGCILCDGILLGSDGFCTGQCVELCSSHLCGVLY